MIFFTRALQDGIQDDSGWARRARRTFERNRQIYDAYLKTITPLLPRSVVRFCQESLHDARIESVSQKPGMLILILDCGGVMGRLTGRRLQLTFSGVRRRVPARGLAGEWWLYDEIHLTSRAPFALHVLFSAREIEVEAEEVAMAFLPMAAAPAGPRRNVE